MNIYFTNSLISAPQIERPGPIDWPELFSLAIESLSQVGQNQLRRLRSLIDAENTRSYLQKDPLNPLGNWQDEEIGGENWLDQLPPPLSSYVRSGHKNPHPPSFSAALVEFFAWDAQNFGQENFVGCYFRFELAVRWTLAQLRGGVESPALAKERDELQRVGTWAFVEESLMRFESELPSLLAQLRALYQLHKSDPMQLLRSISQWRLKSIEQLLASDLFSDDHLLTICAQTMIAADWHRMNREVGIAALRKMRSEETRSSTI